MSRNVTRMNMRMVTISIAARTIAATECKYSKEEGGRERREGAEGGREGAEGGREGGRFKCHL